MPSLQMESQSTQTESTPAPRSSSNTFVLGTRNSKLALVQTELVKYQLEQRWPGINVEICSMLSSGDKNLSQPLYLLGGKALWTKELEVALLDSSVDAIVHSLKDVPTTFPDGCELGAVLEREDPSDALVVKDGLGYTCLEEFPKGSVIGTSSVRRVAQLRKKFPELKFADVVSPSSTLLFPALPFDRREQSRRQGVSPTPSLSFRRIYPLTPSFHFQRGNLQTRLRKLDDPLTSYTALILASAGLIRLGLQSRITASVSSPILYHAVGQGALGIEIRSGDARAAQLIGALEEWRTGWCTRAERSMLRVLEGGCSVPVGCETRIREVEEDTNGTGASTGISGGSGNGASNLGHVNGNGIGNGAIVHLDGNSNGNGNGAARHLTQYDTSPEGTIFDVTSTTTSCPFPHLLTTPYDSHSATLTLTGTITSLAGTSSVLATRTLLIHSIAEAESLGASVAHELIAGGGRLILEELGKHVKEVGGEEGQEIPFESNHGVVRSGEELEKRKRLLRPDHVDPGGEKEEGQGALEAEWKDGFLRSPRGERTVFKESEVCLRPAGW